MIAPPGAQRDAKEVTKLPPFSHLIIQAFKFQHLYS